MGETLKDYCVRCGRQALLAQWHTERNAPLTPNDVSFGSHRPVWWRCEQGHQWQSPPYARTGKESGCPYCAGRKTAPGRDLASACPWLVPQWDGEKNGTLTPQQLTAGSRRSVWWRCEKGHRWKALVKSRAAGTGCPVCAGKKVVPGENDLASCAPQLAAEWDREKNGTLTARQVTCGSGRKVWWRCERGHQWQAAVSSRVSGKGCPVCAGRAVVQGENDLQSAFPRLAAEWDREKNGTLTPQQVSACSNRSVWWCCEKGHRWQAAVSARTAKQSGCPYCTGHKALPGFNDLQTVYPLLAAQWHPTLNGTLQPQSVLPGSGKKVWWRCRNGHEWKAVIYSRTGGGSGCPVCAGKRDSDRNII